MKKDYRKYSETSKNEEVQLTIDDIQEVVGVNEIPEGEEVIESVIVEMTDVEREARIAAIKEELTKDMSEDDALALRLELAGLGYEGEVKENEVTDEITQNDSEEHTGETGMTPVEITVDDIVGGELTGCTKLNVRAEASKDSEVVCVIDKNTSFTVNLTASTEDFYKIYTSVDEVLYEGFCVKQFISIK